MGIVLASRTGQSGSYHTGAARAVWNALQEHPGLTKAEYARLIGASFTEVWNAMQRLSKRGMAEARVSVEVPRQGKVFRWFPISSTSDALTEAMRGWR